MNSLQLIFQYTGPERNILDERGLKDELGLTLIRNLSDDIWFERIDNMNRLSL
jgi:hypothetical protein